MRSIFKNLKREFDKATLQSLQTALEKAREEYNSSVDNFCKMIEQIQETEDITLYDKSIEDKVEITKNKLNFVLEKCRQFQKKFDPPQGRPSE